MAGVVQVPWYATVFRSDRFAEALEGIAAISMRYGALEYEVFRSRDDAYKFLQSATFEDKADWDRYWNGPEFTEFRVRYSSWYQVPVVYGWHDRIASGARGADGNGVTADALTGASEAQPAGDAQAG